MIPHRGSEPAAEIPDRAVCEGSFWKIRVIRDDVNSRGLHLMPAIGALARFPITKPVPACRGLPIYSTCPTCHGAGRGVPGLHPLPLSFAACLFNFGNSGNFGSYGNFLSLYTASIFQLEGPPRLFSNFYGYRMDIPAVPDQPQYCSLNRFLPITTPLVTG